MPGPVPPRFWWLKRLAVVFGVYFLALVALRVWWGYEAERRLQAKIAEYRAAGQPVLIEDFIGEPILDEENGAYYLETAAAKFTVPDGLNVDLDALADDPNQCAFHRDELRQIIEANAEVLALVRTARSRAATRWSVRLRSPAVYTPLPHLSGQRQLAKLLSAAVIHAHQRGDDREAIARAEDALAIGRHVGRSPSTLISHLVGLGIDALTMRTIEAIAPDVRVTRSGQSPPEPGAAPRDEVERLIRSLLDEHELAEARVHAFYGERMLALDTVIMLALSRVNISSVLSQRPAGGAPPLASLAAPLWKLDAVRAMGHYDAMIAAAEARNWPTARDRLPPDPMRGSLLERITGSLSSILIPSIGGAVTQDFMVRAYRRMAALLLAIRLYELDHGQRPAALDALVPEYLAAVPRDPFDPNDGPIRYLPDADPPLLYSFGENCVDDAGKYGSRSDGTVDRRAADLPFFLDGDRPRPKPGNYPADEGYPWPPTQPTSQQGVDDEDDVENAEREDGGQQREG